MKFDDFRIAAEPVLMDAYCKECSNQLVEVSNGWVSRALFCPKCELVYTIKLIKVNGKKVSEKYLAQCRKEAERKHK